MKTCYAVNCATRKIAPVSVTPPYSVQEDGTIAIPGVTDKVFEEFSRAKNYLVKHLRGEKDSLQLKINEVRKLTRGDINRQAAAEMHGQPPADQPG